MPLDTAAAFQARGANPKHAGPLEKFTRGLHDSLRASRGNTFNALATMGSLHMAFRHAQAASRSLLNSSSLRALK